jgi:hypothetical protein
MTMRRIFPQPDLFETPPPRIVFAPADRTKLVDQLRALLIEAMAILEVNVDAQDRLEAGDDEDHA